MRSLIVLRHGQTPWNAEQRFQGHSDTPLDGTGRKQALDAAAEIAPLRPGLVLCSDLQRARCTAEPLVSATGALVVVDAALREINLGAWEGLVHAEAAARFPEEYDAWRAGVPLRRGGGETEAEAGARAAAFITAQFRRLEARYVDTVAVVSHGTVLRAALTRLEEDGAIDLDGPAPRLGNAEWRRFVWVGP